MTRQEVIETELRKLYTDDPTAADLSTIDKALGDIARKQGNLTRRLAGIDDDVTTSVFTKELASLAAQQRQLQAEREAVLLRQATWQAAQDKAAALEVWCRTIAARLGTLTYEQRRLAIQALGVEVRIYRNGHTPRHTITATIPVDLPDAPAPPESDTTPVGCYAGAPIKAR